MAFGQTKYLNCPSLLFILLRKTSNAPLSFLAATLYRAMSKKGYGKKDFSGVYKYMYQDKLEIPEAVAKFLAATETEQVVQRTKGKKMKA